MARIKSWAEQQLEIVCRDAQRTANRDNRAVVVLNLNRVGEALYVIRAWNDQAGIVARFGPQPGYEGRWAMPGWES